MFIFAVSSHKIPVSHFVQTIFVESWSINERKITNSARLPAAVSPTETGIERAGAEIRKFSLVTKLLEKNTIMAPRDDAFRAYYICVGPSLRDDEFST